MIINIKKLVLASLTIILVLTFGFAIIMLQAQEQPQSGVNGSEIVIGSSVALTGNASFLGTEVYTGAQLYIDKINATGGVNGRKIKTIVYDDKYDPYKTVENTRKLITEDNVFALFNYVGTPTTAKVLPVLDELKIPLIGLFTGAKIFRDPLNPHIFNIRASYYDEITTFVKAMVEDLNLKKIAVFYQFDAYGFDGLESTRIALDKYGLKPVVEANYLRGTTDIESAEEKIEKSGADAVIMVGTYEPCSKFIKLARKNGYKPIFYNVSFVGTEALMDSLNGQTGGIVVSTVMPPLSSEFPLIKEYVAALKEKYPDKKPTFGGLEGYANAKVLVEALKLTGTDLTHENFEHALERINNFSLGLEESISYNSTDHLGLSKIYLNHMMDGEFRQISNFKDIRSLINHQ